MSLILDFFHDTFLLIKLNCCVANLRILALHTVKIHISLGTPCSVQCFLCLQKEIQGPFLPFKLKLKTLIRLGRHQGLEGSSDLSESSLGAKTKSLICHATLSSCPYNLDLLKPYYHMSLVVRKPVFGVSDLIRHKSDCTTTQDG